LKGDVILKVTVMNRHQAVYYCYKENSEPTLMISISDPRMKYVDKPFCAPNNMIAEILPLMFSDADKPEGWDVYGNRVTSVDLMTDEDGKKVAEFLNRHNGEHVIVHCDGGISRSSGVAAAIMNFYNGDDSPIFDSGYYKPNMWCYRKTLNALHQYGVKTT
jgi:predicted protein tyrosine phosphatase